MSELTIVDIKYIFFLEFDAFLQQRAVSGGTKSNSKTKPSQRQMKKDVDDSDEMFGL